MNKKLLTILALLIVIGSVSAVSAFDLGDLFGGHDDKNQTVTIEGFKFNIPSDYKETPVPNETAKTLEHYKEDGINFTVKNFVKDEKNALEIGVMKNLTDSQIEKLVPAGSNNTTIAGNTGNLREENGLSVFTYVKDSNVITITGSDKEIINEVLKA